MEQGPSDVYGNDSFSELDRLFADWMVKLSDGSRGVNAYHLWLGAALVSNGVGQGHVCTLLTDFAGQPIPGQETGLFPEIDAWKATLKASPVVGAPFEFKPLILDAQHRLYLQRYWSYEWEFAQTILSRATTINPALDEKLLKDGLQRLFAHGNDEEVDWQKVAALVAARSSLTVISGGPGTGKTFTVAKVLALILEQAKERRCTVALAAPTGKAAARLKGVITSAKSSLDCAEHIKAAIPEEASTIHRLLSPIGGSRRFRFNKDNHLPYDVVVVDETSMSDLPLMAKLGEALSPKAQLILLGDKDQLASVEPGAVFGDLCDAVKAPGFSKPFTDFAKRVAGCDLHGAGEHTSPLSDSVVVLTKNYRFSEESGIGKVSRLINSGKGEEALDLIQSGSSKDVSWQPVPSLDRLPGKLESILIEHYSAYLKAAEPDAAFDLFNRFHILCALREGPYGAKAINQMIENVALKRRLIRREGRWYRGQPVMVVVNDYQLKLFNGDIGILLSDPDSRSLRVHFPTEEGMFRKILPGRLPPHEPAYALTVHKSQGSEFDHVLVILPDRYAEVVTRELIYTAITRARASVEIWGREEVFLQAMAREAHRVSGLKERLRNR
jgi:exodeoxyribonuclease V alpha subunit